MASKQWIVGYFEGENKYSVIPESWLILCGKMYISKWPKSGNIPRMISECTEYEIDWPTYPVKVVSRFYNNYKEASKKEKELFISASASESDCIVNNLPDKSKKSRKRTLFNLNESIDSTTSSTQISPIKVYKANVGVGDDTSVSSNAKNTTLTNYSSADAEIFQSITSALTHVYDNDGHGELSIEPRQELFPACTFSVDQISNDNNNQYITTEQNDLNKLMLEKITTILAYVKRIDGKLDAMGCNLNTSYSRTSVENNFLSLFPMKTVESLEEIESKLILDSVFEEKLIDCVTQIGGTNIHNFTKRVYSRLFTNQLATSYSWTGFRNNNQLQHLRITKIIKDVCMKNFKGTEVEFEANVKNWFKNGSQRQSREKQ